MELELELRKLLHLFQLLEPWRAVLLPVGELYLNVAGCTSTTG